MNRAIGLALCGMLWACPVAAGDINHFICRSADMDVIERSKELTIFTFHDTGLIIGQVENEAFHAMNSRCNGILRFQPDYRASVGYCKYTDNEEHAVILEWRNAGGKKTWEFISATGKWQGISGGGSYNVYETGIRTKSQVKGTFQNCVHVTGTFELPK